MMIIDAWEQGQFNTEVKGHRFETHGTSTPKTPFKIIIVKRVHPTTGNTEMFMKLYSQQDGNWTGIYMDHKMYEGTSLEDAIRSCM